MITVGCDYKMRQVAIACAEEGWADSYTCEKHDRMTELVVLSEWFRQNMPKIPCTLWIESAIQGHANVQTTVKMAQTQGAIMTSHHGPCFVVAPASWKAGLPGLGGHADKDLVDEWLKEFHPDLWEVCSTQDEIDAMCMSLYGMIASGGTP